MLKTCRKCGAQYDDAKKPGYRGACPECKKAYSMEWHAQHPMYIRDQDRKRRLADPEAHRKANRERSKLPSWRAKHIERCHRRRARKFAAALEPFTDAQWQRVLDFYGHACVYCGGAWAERDHHIPLAKGGAHALYNLVPACRDCNTRKRERLWRLPVEHPWMYGDPEEALRWLAA